MRTLQDKIKFLYPKRADEVCQKLCQILEDFRHISEVKAAGKRPVFSEKDVVLICYPDHVCQKDNQFGCDRTQFGTLKILHQFLKKYAKGLVNKIHLLPFYPYSSDEGFSVIDYYQVKKEFGNWEDVKKIGKDFGLMFDFVLNHISSKSQWFQKFLAGDQKYKDYFIAFDKRIDTPSVYRPRTHPLLTPFAIKNNLPGSYLSQSCQTWQVNSTSTKYVWTTFSSDQVDLNFKNPEVLLEMIKALLFYVSKGASIIRLDGVRYLWKELGTRCVDLPQTHTIVKLLRQVLQEVASEVWLISEVKGSLDEALSYFGEYDETHLIYNFQLPALLLSVFFKGEATELTKWARGLKTLPSQTAFFNVTATHDGIGLTPLAGFMSHNEITKLVNYALESKGLINYHLVGERPKPYELNIVYLDALRGVKPFLASQAIQLSLQGVPGIYFNSLIGGENWHEGVKKFGNRAINREKFDYQKLVDELENKRSIKHQVYSGYQKLVQARINEPLFSPLAGQEIINLHPKIFAILRFNRQERLLSLTNVSGQNIEIATQTIAKMLGKDRVKDLISGQEVNLGSKNLLDINPYQSFWLR